MSEFMKTLLQKTLCRHCWHCCEITPAYEHGTEDLSCLCEVGGHVSVTEVIEDGCADYSREIDY